MKKIQVALLGCGDRGCIYADYSLRNPDDMEVVAVTDISDLKREEARVRYNLPADRAFDSVEAFIAAGIECDIAVTNLNESGWSDYEKSTRIGNYRKAPGWGCGNGNAELSEIY